MFRLSRHKEAVIRLIGGVAPQSFHTFPTFPHNFCLTPKKAQFAMPLKAKKKSFNWWSRLIQTETWLIAKLMACIVFWGFGLTIPAPKYFFRFWENVRKVLRGAFLAHCVQRGKGWSERSGYCNIPCCATPPHPTTALHKGFSGFSSHPSYMLYVHIYSLSGGFRIFKLGLEFIRDLPEERKVKDIWQYSQTRQCPDRNLNLSCSCFPIVESVATLLGG